MFDREEMRGRLEEFRRVYEKRFIRDNAGGMLSAHQFALWFLLKKLEPTHIVESGVWKGQSTWLIEQTCPNAKLYCIDPELSRIEYRSKKAKYFTEDFSKRDWSALAPETTLLFFDDHQNAVERVKLARKLGFRHLVFDDNYPDGVGDCLSLKQAKKVDGVETYFEFPPIFKLAKTRWGQDSAKIPTPEPLLEKVTAPWQEIFLAEASSYTWICYAYLSAV